ncbi:Ni/Fe hydrogenase subunit alpha [Candidatus Pacearchaeota archaeon]|nr:Ni/Fe hydrogenase subunit alpha [Candidatus Pacearchaeota archaeon]
MTTEINLNHICKIEGHAHLSLKIENNIVKECKLKASEGARFFEGLVVGKNISDIQEIVSRICGICSSSHSVASIQALENAINIKPSKQQIIIREFLMIGERIRSHSTHLYFLALPDYFNKESALQMLPEHRETINDALALISLGNKIVETFGGREMHPFLEIKKEFPNEDLEKIKEKLLKSKPLIIKTIELFKNLKIPEIKREINYLSLYDNNTYPDISGDIKSSNNEFSSKDYKKHLSESIKEYATSKFILMNNKPYMLGSMSRINNNNEFLDNETLEVLENTLTDLKITLPLLNPFHNLLCQAIEILESTNKAIKLIEDLPKIKPEKRNFQIRKGTGVSAVEAPRGLLFHEYKIDKDGIITYCNIITPTVQNLNMIETDIIQLVNNLLKIKTKKETIIKEIEKLIRAYDPCFSCSTHFLEVDWN